MNVLTCPLTLASGATITIQAWSYLTFTAQFLDLRNLLAAFRERVGSGEGDVPQQLLLDRVITGSVPSQADRELITVPDLPDLFEVIFELNRLEEVAAKPLGLHLRLLQAEADVLEAPQEPKPMTLPS